MSQELTRILFIRHGQTMQNVHGIIQGHLDSKLDETGLKQARRLAKRLKSEERKVDAIYASPLKRAKNTAQESANEFDLEVFTRDNLREAAFGFWEGKTFEEVHEIKPGARDEYLQNWFHYQGHGGESWEILLKRVKQEFYEILDQHQGETVLIFSHGGPIRLFTMDFLACPRERPPVQVSSTDRPPFLISNTAITEFQFSHEGFLTRLNDTAHLS